MRTVVGLDIADGGWVAVRLEAGRVVTVDAVARAGDALAGADRVGIDVPVGLVDGTRDCDVAARRVLGRRASSVFPAVARTLLDDWRAGRVASHADAVAVTRTVAGTGLSRQAFGLISATAEADDLVAAGAPLREVHPEVAFALLDGAPLASKRTWGGSARRRALLASVGVELPDAFQGSDRVAPDDVLDAAVCAWVAAADDVDDLRLPDPATQWDRDRPILIHARRRPSRR